MPQTSHSSLRGTLPAITNIPGLDETARMKSSHLWDCEPLKQIGSTSAFVPLLTLVSLLLELLQLLASLLLNLLSNTLAMTTTTSTTSKPWRLLTLNLEGHMDCPVCGILLNSPSVIQSKHLLNRLA